MEKGNLDEILQKGQEKETLEFLGFQMEEEISKNNSEKSIVKK